jgi:hypothetical protein
LITSGRADKPTDEVDGAFKLLSAGSGGERSASISWWVSWVSGDEPCGSVYESTIAFAGGNAALKSKYFCYNTDTFVAPDLTVNWDCIVDFFAERGSPADSTPRARSSPWGASRPRSGDLGGKVAPLNFCYMWALASS